MQPEVVQCAPRRQPAEIEYVADLIPGRIAAFAAATPHALAIIDGNQRLTYAEMDRRSSQLALRLRGANIGTDSCVGLFMERSADFVVAALAVMKSGAAYLPLDSTTPSDRAEFILADAGASALLTHRGIADKLRAGPWRAMDFDDTACATDGPATDIDNAFEPSPASLAYIIYTSGSTGRPKGVEITHANLNNLIAWHQSAFNVTAIDHASHVAGLGFDAAAWEIWPHLTAGASLYIADELTRRSPQALRDWLVKEQITISFVPTILAEQLLHSTWPPDTALRILLTGADTLHRRPPKGLPFVLVNNYGPTECTVVATSGTIAPDSAADSAADAPPSIGRAITHTTALVLDDALHEVARGVAGELCLGGAGIGRGYRNNPTMTAERFVTCRPASGPAMRIYRTGDRARIMENGEIAFLGRLDDQVKIRGYRVEPGEIVACLNRHPGVEASAVVVCDAGDGGADPVAGPALLGYVVGVNDTRLTATELREFLALRLPEYMIPARFVGLAALPITANGKLDKSALPQPAPENLLANTASATGPGAEANETESPLEQRIAALVATLLGQPKVQRDDNFFMIGGHSMLGVQLVARVRDAFGVKLALRQLFMAPTIAALSIEVGRLIEAAGAATAPKT